ncbi:co-chaperone GroES [Candidimonas sp. SYP-B2681]|uniref:co-chaperone GroES n=1 Tax=Candidimonas sp. SYP-B2681 TaxID=2497686 RepID=UPI000F897967|nr:co-chaperone GroES [Candidimonas sp. SYP-B2681]RTZ47835.1 co-chaperone GroES [Candidimonas sp. SYP-B2681]
MEPRPLRDRIIVKRTEQQRKTTFGIVIPDSVMEKHEQGEVLAVGEGKRSQDGTIIPLQLKVGDYVLFGKYAGQSINIDGEEVLVLREGEVLAVIEASDQAFKRAA